jgi:heavy metal sensor kinase
MKRLSIGVRLTLWYVAIFALGELVFGAGMWFILRGNLYDLVDDGVESQADDLKNFLATQSKDSTLAQLQEKVKEKYSVEHTGDYLALYADDGLLVYLSSFLQNHPSMLLPPEQVKRPISRSRRVEHKPFRFLFEKLDVNGHSYIVEMGAPADDAVETLEQFRTYLWMFAPLVLLVAAFVGYWMSRRALAPVDELVRTARQVSGTNMSSRLQKLDTGDELQRLSDTLNEMLDRIEAAFLRVTQFTADASHELRTPIALIRTDAELALRRSRSEPEYQESLRHILLEAERTTILIEQLLSIARADSGREQLRMQSVDLRPILRGVIESWRQVASLGHVRFSAAIEDQDAFVMGDETLLRRLADILLDNAFKYTPDSGSVRLVLESGEQSLAISVEDSGVGIAKEEQQKIFERFYRVDKARSRVEGGAGLGLAIAQWIVNQHGGSIAVESSPGQGAIFRVELPKIPAPVASPQPA